MNTMKNRYIVSLLVIIVAMIVPHVTAQYQLFRWVKFEKGKIPPESSTFGKNKDRMARVVDLSTIPNMPPAFRSGVGGSETGRYGLWLKAHPDVWIVGLADNVLLDRARLGMRGRALYQADFFIPPQGQYIPSLAVLAMEPLRPGDESPRSFYRFGFTLGRSLYFSHVIQDEETARVFLQDLDMGSLVPRPGWHRFAIVFEGPKLIHCYIDGHETNFSPIEDDTIKELQVGVMLAEKEKEYNAYVDNLSIQWTPEDAPLPESPYAPSWGDAPVPNLSALTTPNPAATPIRWLDTREAWSQCQATRKPMLVYFYAPHVDAAVNLDRIFQSDPSAQQYLKQYIPVKIDVNQYQGGDLARKFQIFKVPTLVLMNPGGQVTKKAIFGMRDTWSNLHSKLTR